MEQKQQKSDPRNLENHFGYRKVEPGEKIKLVQQHFDTVAARYDFSNTVLSLGLDRIWRKKAVKMLGLRPGDRILDLCGGTAELALLAAVAAGESGRVTLYDINRAMMLAGKSKVSDARLDNRITFVQGDAEQLSLASASFDAVMVGFGIRNLTHIEKGFQDMNRILKKGGKLLCLEFSQPQTGWFRALYDFYSFYIMPWVGKILVGSRDAYSYLPESIRLFPSPDDLSRIIESAGFSHVHFKGLTNGIAMVHLGIKE